MATDDGRSIYRRISGLRQSIAELREKHADMESEVETVQDTQERLEDQMSEFQDSVHGFKEDVRRIHVHEDGIKDLNLRMQGKVGMERFEELAAQVRQLRAQIELLADAMDTEEAERELKP